MEQQSSVEFLFDKNLCKACGICVALCPKKFWNRPKVKSLYLPTEQIVSVAEFVNCTVPIMQSGLGGMHNG